MKRPLCLFCLSNQGEEIPAAWWAPQDNGDGTFTLSPACHDHIDGWWDGSDFPDGKGAPPITSIIPA